MSAIHAHPQFARDAHQGGTVLGLSGAQVEVLTTLREVVCGNAIPCPIMSDLVETLARNGRRRLRLGLPSDLMLTPDEMSLLALMSAAVNGDEDEARTRAKWLVRPAGEQGIIHACRRLSRPCGRYASYDA